MAAREVGAAGQGAVLALTLDLFQRDGKWYALQTDPVTRTGGYGHKFAEETGERISVPAQTIMGFTLTTKLTV